MSDAKAPAARGRTFWGIAGDMFFFGVGQGFAGQTTVIPSFLSTLTTSAPLIGLAATLCTGGWLIPQLFAANSLAGHRRRKAFVGIPARVGRLIMLVIGPIMLILAPRNPSAALAAFLLLYLLFWIADGIASVAWLDILGQVPHTDCPGPLISLGTVVPGIAGIGAGAVVSIVLASPSIGWPANYAILFLACGILFSISLICFLLIREEPLATVQAPLPWPSYFRRLAAVVRSDRPFRRAVGIQVCFGSLGMAAPFYIVHGLENLGFPSSSAGIFTSVQLVGGVGGALLVGLLGERRGTRAVMRAWGGLAIAAPLVGLTAPFLAGYLPGAVLPIYAIAFIIVGVQGIANLAGFMNWVLEYAPASDRPLYIGFANTLGGITLVMPLIGGWILAATNSYSLLFAVSAIGPAAALLLLRGLPEPRHSS